MMGKGVGDKMEDDDWTKVLGRKSKARHKESDYDSECEREIKRNKKDGDSKKKLDKYQATRVLSDKSDDQTNTNETGNEGKQNGDFSDHDYQNTRTQKQTGTIPKSDKYTTRQSKDKTDGTYNDGWTKNQHYKTFIIEKEMKDEDKANKVKYPHPLEVAKMLKNIGVTKYSAMKGVGRGKFQISFDKPRDAEQLINSTLLKESFGYTIFVPMRFKESVGVVGDIPPSITENEVMENTVCENNIKITKVERIKKRVGEGQYIPTYSVKIFVKGENLPETLEIYGANRFVEPYVFPLKLCVKCWRFGHRETYCKAKEARCCNCGQEHGQEKCETTEPKCVNCAGNHKASSKECPERARQDKIRQDMAINKSSYFEASDKYPKHQKNNLQGRLDSIRDYPPLTTGHTQINKPATKKTRKIVNITPNYPTPENWFNIQNPTTEFVPNPYKTSDIERITQIIKDDLITQFNLNTMFEKIKAIQQNIIQSMKKTDTIQQDLLLINISEELNKIVNPEVST